MHSFSNPRARHSGTLKGFRYPTQGVFGPETHTPSYSTGFETLLTRFGYLGRKVVLNLENFLHPIHCGGNLATADLKAVSGCRVPSGWTVNPDSCFCSTEIRLHTRLGSAHECHSGVGLSAFALVSFLQVGLAIHGLVSVEFSRPVVTTVFAEPSSSVAAVADLDRGQGVLLLFRFVYRGNTYVYGGSVSVPGETSNPERDRYSIL
uniref:Uncharacterized protein n=1 Tax=Ananas comosus var. bracteatus TaxID=296719 RepID=A0A6V7Q6G1_ANACO|nr:unnamed protein product [Ananas comosus var. bracteatus]